MVVEMSVNVSMGVGVGALGFVFRSVGRQGSNHPSSASFESRSASG